MKAVIIAMCGVLAGVMSPAVAKEHRSHAALAEFQRQYPCPSTGLTRGACPGWVKDHVWAICKGGPDNVVNLQWQSVAAAKAKDKWECK